MFNVYACHRPLTEKFGLWDCLRVDYGTEWFLMLTAQDMLRHHRNDRSKLPYVQTTSKRVQAAINRGLTLSTLCSLVIVYYSLLQTVMCYDVL